MVKAMHDVVLTSTKVIVQATNDFFVSANEVTTLYNQHWINATTLRSKHVNVNMSL